MIAEARPQRQEVLGIVESLFAISRITSRDRSLAKLRQETEEKVARIFKRQERAVLQALGRIRSAYPVSESFVSQSNSAIDVAIASVEGDFAKVLQEAAAAGMLKGWKLEQQNFGYGISPEFNLENPRAVQFLKNRGLEQAKRIDTHTKNVLRRIVVKRVENGDSYTKTTAQIRQKFSSFSEARARRIAVYESAVAYEAGGFALAQEVASTTGLEYEKRILIVGDDRTEEHCWDADAQGWIPLQGSFAGVGTAPLHVGCRCSTQYRRKPGQAVFLPPVPPQPAPKPRPKPKRQPKKEKLLSGAAIRDKFQKSKVGKAKLSVDLAPLKQEVLQAGKAWMDAKKFLKFGSEAYEKAIKRLIKAGEDFEKAERKVAPEIEKKRKALHKLLELGKEDRAQVTHKWLGSARVSKAQKAKAQKAAEFLSSILEKSKHGDLSFSVLKVRGRAFARHETMSLHMDPKDKTRVYVHEAAHLLETNKQLLEKVLKFYDKRTKGERFERLRDVTGLNYPVSEVTKKDKFIDPYMGKTYGRKATELTSMAAEMLFAEPARFARLDPEMFDFFVDLFRGIR